MRRASPFPSVLLAMLAAASLLGCGDSLTPEDEIRALIGEGVRACEEGELDALMKLVAEDYEDERGNDRRALRLTVGYYLRSYGTLHLLHRVTGVELASEEEGRVTLAVALAARPLGSGADLGQIEADILRLELSAARRRGGWKVTAARWERGGPGDFL
jgi:hypothetical protein